MIPNLASWEAGDSVVAVQRLLDNLGPTE